MRRGSIGIGIREDRVIEQCTDHNLAMGGRTSLCACLGTELSPPVGRNVGRAIVRIYFKARATDEIASGAVGGTYCIS